MPTLLAIGFPQSNVQRTLFSLLAQRFKEGTTLARQIASQLAAVRAQLKHADVPQVPKADIGALIIAISTLADVVEQLGERVADLARVQNERATD